MTVSLNTTATTGTSATLTSTTELRGVPLKTGQVLSAIVLEANQRTGQALLSLAGGQVRVQTQQPLVTGSAIRLTVQTPGPPLVLNLQTEAPATPSALNAGQAALLNRLLGALAQRVSQSAGQTISSSPAAMPQKPGLATTTAPPSAAPSASALPAAELPTVLQRALLPLQQGSPSSNAPPPPIDTGKLAAALGAFVQQNSRPGPPPDATTAAPQIQTLHTALQQAAQQLRQAKPTATLDNAPPATPSPPAASPSGAATAANPHTVINQWLNQLETSQLRTAIQHLSGTPSWLIDAPVLVHDQAHRLQLAIQPDAANTAPNTEAPPWQLDFALELPQFGALHGSLRLQGQTISVRLYADQPDSQTALRNELPRLDQQLRAADFTPQHLDVYPGPPPASTGKRLTPALNPEHNLLTVKV